jgi:general stress protein YciG
MTAEQQHRGNPGNFAEDREKASRAGHLGGQHSSGNFANNPQRAAEAGRKGGLAGRAGTSSPSRPPRAQPVDPQSNGDAEPSLPGSSAGNREKERASGLKDSHAPRRA